MNTIHEKLQETSTYQIAKINWLLESLTSVSMLKSGSSSEQVSIGEFRILAILAERGSCNMRELRDAVLIESTTLTRTIQRMLNRSLLERKSDPRDRRRVIVFLTLSGKRLFHSVRGAVYYLDTLLKSKVQHIRLAETLKTLLDTINEIAEKPKKPLQL